MKIGFLGAGNMGGAMIRGYAAESKKKGQELFVYDPDADKLKKLGGETGIVACGSQEDLAASSDVLILCIKPGMFETVLPGIAPHLKKDATVVSIAAGISIGYMESLLGKDTAVVRIMPNTPAMVGEAMIAVSGNDQVDDGVFSELMHLFESIGRAEVVNEELMDCVIGVSGSSPAYTYMYIEALAEEAARCGMAREQATLFAAQAVLGAAKMVLETGETPGKLRENVCSPGGTTIEAVKVLMANGFTEKAAEGFRAAVKKSGEMTK